MALNLISQVSYACSICARLDLSISSSSWGLGRAAVCDCVTPWTFLLPFFLDHSTMVFKSCWSCSSSATLLMVL